MDEEKNLHLDKPGKGKTLDQMKKHTLDSSLDSRPIDRAMHILTSGDDPQKVCVIQSLPQLISLDSQSTYTRVIPKIQHDLMNSSSEFQISASHIFKTLVETKPNASIFASVVQGVDAKDPNVASSWCDTLLTLIPTLNEDTIKNSVLPLVRSKSGPSQSNTAKIFASNLIGKISIFPRLNNIDIKKDLLPLVLGLCQDCAPAVRAAICSNLSYVAQGIGQNFVKTNLLPSIVELACDDNANVRGSAIVTIAAVLPYLDNDTKKETMVPLMKQLSEKALKKNDGTVIILANEYGRILKGLEQSIPNAEVEYFLKNFKGFSQMGKCNTDVKADASKDVLCRERCASNIILVLEFTLQVIPAQLTFTYGIFKELAADPCYLVRRSAAATLAQMAKSLGNQNKMLKNELVKLLRDDAIEVLDLLVPTISDTLLSLCESKAMSNTIANQITVDIGRALFKCQTELSKGYNWRLTVTFFSQLECLPFCMPADYIHNNFTPVLMDRSLNGKGKPIRVQAILTLIVFLRYNFQDNQHKWSRESLIKQLARSNSCYTRMLYFNCCEAVLNIFSEKYFKEHFLPPLLALATDKISNIRYGFVMFTSKLKNMATITSDVKTRQMVMETLTKLEASEKNKDVLDLLKQKKKEMLTRRNEERIKEEERRIASENSKVIERESVAAPVAVAAKAPTVDVKNRVVTGPVGPTQMSFLEKHFYTDAGVAIPKEKKGFEALEKPASVEIPTVLSDMKTLNELEVLNTTNITDDVKVNLRKITKNKSKIVPPKVYKNHFNEDKPKKRYSSIISTNCFDKDKKNLNRRSLNLSARDVSKIPVCTRKLDGDFARKSEINTKNLEICDRKLSVSDSSLERVPNLNCSEHFKVKSLSSLPILRRSSASIQRLNK